MNIVRLGQDRCGDHTSVGAACEAYMLARAAYQESTIWVELRYEAEVGTEITTDGMLRLPSFKGLL